VIGLNQLFGYRGARLSNVPSDVGFKSAHALLVFTFDQEQGAFSYSSVK
jgi:hypothetical protein